MQVSAAVAGAKYQTPERGGVNEEQFMQSPKDAHAEQAQVLGKSAYCIVEPTAREKS